MKKYGNPTFSQFFIKNLFFAADDSFADVFCVVSHE